MVGIFKIFQTEIVEKIKTHVLSSVKFSFFPFIAPFMIWRVKYGRGRQATDDSNTAHAFYMLDNYGYERTLRVCNNCCFGTVTVVTRTHLNVTFVHKLSVLFLMTGNDSVSEIFAFCLCK
jgi:hypothetical protein